MENQFTITMLVIASVVSFFASFSMFVYERLGDEDKKLIKIGMIKIILGTFIVSIWCLGILVSAWCLLTLAFAWGLAYLLQRYWK